MSGRLLRSGPPILSDRSVPQTGFDFSGASDPRAAVIYLYPNVPCPVCGSHHTLCHRDDSPGRGASYSFVCPRTGVIVVYCPARDPKPVTRVPDEAVPITWLAD